MAAESQLKRAISLAKSRGVKAVKIEFEALVDPERFPYVEGYPCPVESCHEGRAPLPCKACHGSGEDKDGEDCEDCSGSGVSRELDACTTCQGYGRIEGSRENSAVDYCEEFRQEYRSYLEDALTRQGERFRDVVQFYDASLDISVGTELTLTVPIEKAYVLEHTVRSFAGTCSEFGNDSATDEATKRAGMHMSLLWTKKYPVKRRLAQRPLQSFKQNVEKLRLALIYLGSVDDRTRSLDFRGVHGEQRGCLDYHEDTCVEFRAFDPCYRQPGQALDNFLVMVQTLRFFSEEVERPVGLPSGYHNLVDHTFGGRHDRWGWFPVQEFFLGSKLRNRLLQELAYFADGPLATQRAKDAEKTVAAWK